MYNKVAYQGDIDPAYDIFYTYEDRVKARIEWVFGELKQHSRFDRQRHVPARPDEVGWPATRPMPTTCGTGG